MDGVKHLEETDRLLNELEDMARSSATDARFLEQLLDSLRLLLRAESAGILLAIPPQRSLLLAASGTVPDGLVEKWNSYRDSHAPGSLFASGAWFAFPLHSDNSDECLFLSFRDSIPSSGRSAVISIANAFVEILSIRHSCRTRSIERCAFEFNQILQQVPRTKTILEIAALIATRMTPLVSAVRVSMVAQSSKILKTARLIAVSTCPDFDLATASAATLETIGRQALGQDAPIVRENSLQASAVNGGMPSISQDGSYPNLLALRLVHSSQGECGTPSAIIYEWANREEMLSAIPLIKSFHPNLCMAWQMQTRWFEVPRLARQATMMLSAPVQWLTAARWVRWLCGIALAVAIAWCLARPTAFTIEAESTLVPVSKSTLFASADGFLQQLDVTDGQLVTKGQRLLSLRSPALELQIEETTGQIRAIIEKRSGLRVALNQVSQSTTDAEADRTRISTELLLLEIQEKHAKDKYSFLHQERQRLTMTSPMDGVVVAKDLHRELQSRPLRRGDPLFQVVDLQGEWQLKIRVPDRDVGYVMNQRSQGSDDISFQFESIPGEYFSGKVRYVSSMIENSLGAAGELPIYATVDQAVASRVYMGANARVYFRCGEQPLWFVWCRPIVEAIQRSVWLFDFRSPSTHP
ncbi:MAG: efflux RND transporter periplasmic adaptor subunit [Pirellula sp.]